MVICETTRTSLQNNGSILEQSSQQLMKSEKYKKTGLVDKLKNEALSDALRCKLWQQVLIANAPKPPLA